MIRRLSKLLSGLVPATLGGAFFLLTFGKVQDPHEGAPGLLILGGISGMVIVGLIRLFKIAPWGYPIAGFLVGPLPFLVLLGRKLPTEEDRGSVWVVAALFGVLIGLLEWARVHRQGTRIE